MNLLDKFILIFLLLTLIASPALTENDRHVNPNVPFSIPSHIRPGTMVTDVYSTNWAGYVVSNSTVLVSDVKGSWIVPAVSSKSGGQYSANWIGIYGYTPKTVEQIGTSSDNPSKGKVNYSAWYEFNPDPNVIIPLTIKPGDKISAEVSYSKGQYTLTMIDVTTSKSFTATHADKGYSRNSAEWIVEAPTSLFEVLPLANFGTTYFGSSSNFQSSTCIATIGDSTKGIGSFDTDVYSITMVNKRGQIKAQPSALSTDGTSFSVTWKSAS